MVAHTPGNLNAMRQHLWVFLAGLEDERVERWRQVWDPGMAGVVPAHVTLVHPEETAGESLLLWRAARCRAPAFRLNLGDVFAEDEGPRRRVRRG